MEEITSFLSKIIPLKRCKNNTRVFISSHCPFTGYVSTGRIFRYNEKKKVGKCYCCGNSFKELYWLKLTLQNKLKVDLIRLEHDPLVYSEEMRERYRKRILEDKSHLAYRNFEKSEDDLDLPF